MTPRFYIVIPTRNRHDTLREAIRSALQQDRDDLVVIVSDNHSTPDTEAVFREFSDPRLRYQRSDRSLPMMGSWEFALSGVDGPGLVHFMGDDNGLLPGALDRVANAVDRTGLKIVQGDVVQYRWPGNGRPGYVAVPVGKGDFVADARRSRNAAYRLQLGFDRLPTINTAFVHTDVIERVRARMGRYFAASNPDVFSAVASAMVVDRFVYLRRPFMINGASRHSNGAAGANPAVSSFIEDNLAAGYTYHPNFPASRGYLFNVCEAFAIARDGFAGEVDAPALPMAKILNRTVREEYVGLGRDYLRDVILEFATRNGLPAPTLGPVTPPAPTEGPDRIGAREGDYLVFESPYVRIDDVYEASRFAEAVLANPGALPPEAWTISLRSRIGWALRRLVMGASPLA